MDERLRRMAALGLPLADMGPMLGRSNDCVEVHARALHNRIARTADRAARALAQARWLSAEAERQRQCATEARVRLADRLADHARPIEQRRVLVASLARLCGRTGQPRVDRPDHLARCDRIVPTEILRFVHLAVP